jgi:cellulose synthase/poly-beta-1,6-N-acetylglucosamine synthase-like glycosyltransferase
VTELIRDVLVASQWMVLGYFVLINTWYGLLLASSCLAMRRHRLRSWEQRHWRLLGSDLLPRLSVIAPAHNEGATVAPSVRSLLTLRYPNLEVVVVNDGSSDSTLPVLEKEFELVPVHPVFRRRLSHQPIHSLLRSRLSPQLVVVDKENGGKADALNAGVNVATGELVCAIDADTLIEADALLRLVQPFLEDDDVLAAGGTIRVANGSAVRNGRVSHVRAPRTVLAGAQNVEYLRAFPFGRLGWNRLGGNLIISGAFGLFRKEAIVRVGGYVHETVGEDMELIAHMRRHGIETGGAAKIVFVPDPVAWTEVPESVSVLGRQRDRWQRGLADVLWRYRGLLFNARYGPLGLIVYPYFLFVELLGPALEAFGVVALAAALWLDVVNVHFAILLFLTAYGYGLLLGACTLLLGELSASRYETVRDRVWLLPWLFTETFGYRQLTVVWRLRGLVKYVRGRREWGVMTRTGFTEAEADQ